MRSILVAGLALRPVLARPGRRAGRFDEAVAVFYCHNGIGAGWAALGTIRMEAGSIGFRIGASQTDLIFAGRKGSVPRLLCQEPPLRQDLDDNTTLCGRKLQNRQIAATRVRTPAAASNLIALLNSHSGGECGSTVLRSSPVTK